MSSLMYRSEEVYGSGVRDIKEVIRYEIFELGNTDILIYVTKHYASAFSKTLLRRANQLIDALNGCGLLELSISQEVQFCRGLIDALNKYFKVSLRYCLWLASKAAVKQYYDVADDETIDAYSTSDYILSDLGESGVLFAYIDLPSPLILH